MGGWNSVLVRLVMSLVEVGGSYHSEANHPRDFIPAALGTDTAYTTSSMILVSPNERALFDFGTRNLNVSTALINLWENPAWKTRFPAQARY